MLLCPPAIWGLDSYARFIPTTTTTTITPSQVRISLAFLFDHCHRRLYGALFPIEGR